VDLYPVLLRESYKTLGDDRWAGRVRKGMDRKGCDREEGCTSDTDEVERILGFDLRRMS